MAFQGIKREGQRRGIAAVLVSAGLLWQAGCAELPGLRSVGASRPTLRSLWDRNKEAPAAGADSYALAMHANDGKKASSPPDDAQGPATRNDVVDRKRGEPDLSYPGPAARRPPAERVAEGSRPDRPRSPAAAPERDPNKIEVTLGQPTALPSADANLLAASRVPDRSRRTWHGEGSEPTARESRTEVAASGLVPSATPALDLGATPEPMTDRSPRRSTSPTTAARTQGRNRSTAPSSQEILARVSQAIDRLNAYQVQMTRSERVGNTLQPEERILLSIRREPRAVRLEWENGPSKGREVIYSSAIDQRTLFVHMAGNGLPLPTMKIAVDSPMVRKNSRHSITEAGFDVMLKELLLADSNDPGAVVYKGLVNLPGANGKAHEFVHHTPNNEDWTVAIDPASYLPVHVEARDRAGNLIERYHYSGLKPNPDSLNVADAFDPDKRWGRSDGVLSRFARAALSGPAKDSTTTR